MFIQIKCAFCNQTFDFDSSHGSLLADCPHCGQQNTIAAPSGAAKDMTILHDAPSLVIGKTCPSCKKPVERSAVLCIQCGYNFVTRQKVGGDSWLAANKNLVSLLGGGLVVLVLAATYLFWPEPEAPLPVVSSAAAPAAEQTAPPAAPAPAEQPGAASTNAPAATNVASMTNAAVEPVAPPPGPTPEELAAKQAEAERAALEAERVAFEAKKVQAEQNLRQQLDTREPLYKLGETVELRRKNGVFHKGTLQRFSGIGTNRVAIIATAVGEIDVPLIALDSTPRRRLDPEYREAFIQFILNTRGPAAPGAPAPTNAAPAASNTPPVN
jgi:hypothetical protein